MPTRGLSSHPASDVDRFWMRHAIDMSRRCPHDLHAFQVGAVLVDPHGIEVVSGYSREGGDPKVHAEESALSKIDRVPPGSTLYSTLEPCSQRASRPMPCAQLAIAAGFSRVVIAWREPSLFVADCQGVELLIAAGIEVVELDDMADDVRALHTYLNLDASH